MYLYQWAGEAFSIKHIQAEIIISQDLIIEFTNTGGTVTSNVCNTLIFTFTHLDTHSNTHSHIQNIGDLYFNHHTQK